MLDEKERTACVQQFGRAYRAFMTGFESRVGVPMPRWRVMIALHEGKVAQPQTKLSKALSMDPGALTRQVQQLEQLGWIERCVDERDNRVTNVTLTDDGRGLIESTLPKLNYFMENTINKLPEDMLQSLVQTLTIFENQIATVSEERHLSS